MAFALASPCSSQKAAVKTNLLYDATATINLGTELRLHRQWTFDLSGNYNPWTFAGNKKWKHWLVQPEARYWFCESFSGHFGGLSLFGGEGNIGNIDAFKKLKHYRYDGWCIGLGITYGYAWALGRNWSMEASLGVGYARFDYDKYDCPGCGDWLSDGVTHYFGPVKLALSVIYIIR